MSDQGAVTREAVAERAVGSNLAALLRALLGLGLAAIVLGAALGFVRHGALATATVPLASLPSGLLELNDAAWLTLGILVFLGAPPLAIAYLGVEFARAGDRLHALISVSVLVLLLSGMATALLRQSGSGEAPLPLMALGPEAGVLLASVAAGALGATLGLGGGVFIVPILTVFFGVPLKTSIAASAVSVVVNSLGSTSIYLRHRMTNVRLALFMELTTVVGAVAGGIIVVLIAPHLLRAAFGVALIALAVAMLAGPRRTSDASDAPDPLRLRGAFHDPSAAADIEYVPQRLTLGAGTSTLAGVTSGLFGIGGGAIKMPLLHTIMRVPVKAAAATSVFMVGITVSASAYVYYAHSLIDLSVTVPAILGIQFGSRLGADASRKLRGVTLVRILVVILVYLGVVLLLQAFGIHVPGAAERSAPV